MSLFIEMYQNTCEKSKSYGKWYGRVKTSSKVADIEAVADVIQDNCTVKRSDILAVLSELGPTMKTMLQDSKRVRLPYLGAFKLGVNTIGEKERDDFSLMKNVKNVHVIFQPETVKVDRNTRVKELIRGCELEYVPKTVSKNKASNDTDEGTDNTDDNTDQRP